MQQNDTPTNSAATSTRRISLLYIAALSIVAALAVGGHLLMRRELDRQASDSRVINIAGRQRMLSQRICKSALQWQAATVDSDRQQARIELAEVLHLWNSSHRALRHGDQELGVPGTNSPEVHAMLDAIEPHYQAMYQSAEQLLAAAATDSGGRDPAQVAPLGRSSEQRAVRGDAISSEVGTTEQAAVGRSAIDATAMTTILSSEQAFLRGMDEIVFQYDREASARVDRLKQTEWRLMLVTLLVLVLEGTFVFRPAVVHIRSTLERLHHKSEEARAAQQAAEAASQVKSRFLANMSHEIRTPMNAVLGLNDLVLETDLTVEQRQHLTTARDAAESLLHLINSTLDYAKLDAGQLQLDERPFELRQLLCDTLRTFEVLAEKKQLALVVHVEETTPNVLVGDPDRLRQIITNLVGNAVKFTSQGQVTIKVCALSTISRSQVQLQFSVQDTGIGIATDRRQQIFEPFAQAESSIARRFGGTGLGLSIANELVARMGGTMQVESVVGRGSTFTFTVTLARLLEHDTSGAVIAQLSENIGRNTNGAFVDGNSLADSFAKVGQRILIVEDTAANQLVAATALRRGLHQVSIADDGRTAIESFTAKLLTAERFDLVLLDVQLPDMDGLDVARAIRRIEKEKCISQHTPLIAVTAYASPADRTRCLDAGMTDYLTKPLRPAQLLTMVNDWTSGQKQRIQAKRRLTENDHDTVSGLPDELQRAFERLESDEVLWGQLVDLFLAQSPELIDSIEAALARSDWKRIEFAAHRLAGLVSNLTTGPAHQLAKSLEDAALAQQAEAGQAAFAELQSEIANLTETLQPAGANPC